MHAWSCVELKMEEFHKMLIAIPDVPDMDHDTLGERLIRNSTATQKRLEKAEELVETIGDILEGASTLSTSNTKHLGRTFHMFQVQLMHIRERVSGLHRGLEEMNKIRGLQSVVDVAAVQRATTIIQVARQKGHALVQATKCHEEDSECSKIHVRRSPIQLNSLCFASNEKISFK
eukprot:TRINITY_DN2010_c0_g1_i1.p2 TRINITY_DN2010_c0_g1~~TRINITY_DN2010_c0_g1_i1.p2  ORF type:complete len:175 (-),score=45.69 TRINITY_DN2010_c0_g1_i1:1725-2249(-)